MNGPQQREGFAFSTEAWLSERPGPETGAEFPTGGVPLAFAALIGAQNWILEESRMYPERIQASLKPDSPVSLSQAMP